MLFKRCARMRFQKNNMWNKGLRFFWLYSILITAPVITAIDLLNTWQ
jgi:hypothetical protein